MLVGTGIFRKTSSSDDNGKFIRFVGKSCKNWQGGLHQRKIQPKDLHIIIIIIMQNPALKRDVWSLLSATICHLSQWMVPSPIPLFIVRDRRPNFCGADA